MRRGRQWRALEVAVGSTLTAALALTMGCRRHEAHTPPGASETSGEAGPSPGDTATSTASTRAPEEARERGPRTPALLELEGFLPAPMMVPEGKAPDGGFPVLVIAHGAGGRGEHHCDYWNHFFSPEWLIVCPQGALLARGEPQGGAYYPDHFKLREELQALALALRGRWDDQLRSSFRYMGYSQGATMGALAVVGEFDVFTELVLIEGGSESWTRSRAAAFVARGGTRVILACGTAGCARHAERSMPHLLAVGLNATFVNVPGGGHTYGGAVGEKVWAALASWDTTGDSKSGESP